MDNLFVLAKNINAQYVVSTAMGSLNKTFFNSIKQIQVCHYERPLYIVFYIVIRYTVT